MNLGIDDSERLKLNFLFLAPVYIIPRKNEKWYQTRIFIQ